LCLEQEVDGFQNNYTTLSHELAHAQDRISGEMDNSEWYSYNDGGKKVSVSKAEIYATHIENLIRTEHGLPLRKFYQYGSGSFPNYGQVCDLENPYSLYFIEKYNHTERYEQIKDGQTRYVYK
jgi:hypothetical protein